MCELRRLPGAGSVLRRGNYEVLEGRGKNTADDSATHVPRVGTGTYRASPDERRAQTAGSI